MRVIGGSFKGKKLLGPQNVKTRPLKDLTKESIFNIIKHSNKFKINLEKSNVLDLFAGTGSFGIECLSRGAKHVTFIENYNNVLRVLKKNISNLDQINNFVIVEKDIFKELIFDEIKKKFNIIFLDPPYKEKNLNIILDSINKTKILDKDGILIIHRHKKDKWEYPDNLKIIEEKKYGISKIIFSNIS